MGDGHDIFREVLAFCTCFDLVFQNNSMVFSWCLFSRLLVFVWSFSSLVLVFSDPFLVLFLVVSGFLLVLFWSCSGILVFFWSFPSVLVFFMIFVWSFSFLIFFWFWSVFFWSFPVVLVFSGLFLVVFLFFSGLLVFFLPLSAKDLKMAIQNTASIMMAFKRPDSNTKRVQNYTNFNMLVSKRFCRRTNNI